MAGTMGSCSMTLMLNVCSGLELKAEGSAMVSSVPKKMVKLVWGCYWVNVSIQCLRKAVENEYWP